MIKVGFKFIHSIPYRAPNIPSTVGEHRGLYEQTGPSKRPRFVGAESGNQMVQRLVPARRILADQIRLRSALYVFAHH